MEVDCEEACVSAGVPEAAEKLKARMNELVLADHRGMMDILKSAGVMRIGQRLKLAKVLVPKVGTPLISSATDMNGSIAKEGASSDFWASIALASAAVTSTEELPNAPPRALPTSVQPNSVRAQGVASCETRSSQAPVTTAFVDIVPAGEQESKVDSSGHVVARLEICGTGGAASAKLCSMDGLEEDTSAIDSIVEAVGDLVCEGASRSPPLQEGATRGTDDDETGGAAPEAASPPISFELRSLGERAEILRICGNDAYARSNLRGAEDFYRKALELVPAQPEVLNNLAACALAAAPPEPSRALLLLAELFELHPRHTKGRMRAARCHVMLGQLQAALAEFDAAVASEEVSAAPREVAVQAAGQCTQGSGESAHRGADEISVSERSDEMTAARKKLESASSPLMTQAIEGREHTVHLIELQRRGSALALTGRVDKALEIADEIARSCTCSVLGDLVAVSALEGGGRPAAALGEVERALGSGRATAPEEAQLRLICARLLGRVGMTTEAEQALRTCAAAAPPCAAAERALEGMQAALQLKRQGNDCYSRGDYAEAIASYDLALQADQAAVLTPLLLGNRAQAYLQSKMPEEALQDCHRAVSLDSSSVKALLRRAACRAALGMLADAAADFERVLQLQPGNPTALDGRQRAAAANGGCGFKGREEEAGELRGEEDFDPYEVLGVKRTANVREIKAAFRRLALQYHPDKYAGEEKELAAEKFNRAKLAHSVLSDDFRRGQLDAGMANVSQLASDESQSQWDRMHDYFSDATPGGYQRKSDTGQRRWNPKEKPSATFDVNPCRIDAHVLAADNSAASLSSKRVICLKNRGAMALRNTVGSSLK